MKHWTTMSLATCVLAGCAGASQARSNAQSAAEAPPSALAALEERGAEQERRIAELEARLGLLEQEARRWRAEVPIKPTQTVRIGSHRDADARAEQAEPEPTEPSRRRGAVPVVRLHQRDLEPVDAPISLPEPPAGVPEKLAVVPLPAERARKALAGNAEPVPDGAARERYRAALRALRDRRWDEALQLLNRLLDEHGDSSLALQATYWRGEVHYAQRRYREALIDFETVALRKPSSKAAEALLKLGLCHQRLGDPISAERYFRQLREQYPSSDAARIASRENPS